jgi:hypothetical protein
MFNKKYICWLKKGIWHCQDAGYNDNNYWLKYIKYYSQYVKGTLNIANNIIYVFLCVLDDVRMDWRKRVVGK